VSGVRCQCSAPPLAKKNGQSDQKRNSEKANIEYRIMNVEVMYSVYFIKDWAKRFHPSTFCGSIFDILRLAVPTMCSFILCFGFPLLRSSLLTSDTRHLKPDFQIQVIRNEWLLFTNGREVQTGSRGVNQIILHEFRIRPKRNRRSRVQRFRGSRLHSRPWTAFGKRIYEKSVSFVRPNPKFGAKLAIIWQNEYF
jgi:hypothetical protein